MKNDATEKAQPLDLAHVRQRIDEAREKVLVQQRKVEHAARIGLSVHEEEGRLMIMLEALEMMTKRCSELAKSM